MKTIDKCLDCGHTQDSGPCAVCPHMPGDEKGHFFRRPCENCGSSKLISSKVAPLGAKEA